MNYLLRPFAGALLFAASLAAVPSAPAQDAPPPADGVAVQPRGPVHEAFARPADVTARSPVIPKEPPPPIRELPPEQRPAGENVQWVPGYWAWNDEAADFLWVSGCWRVPPPDRTWVAGSWAQVDGGWQWRNGFWAGADAAAPQQLDAVPPQSLENGPSTPAPDADSYYVPGQWVFRDGEWAWQPGAWVPNPGGMVYTPPAYLPADPGSLYVPGYWDYPPEDRGLLFAPVCFAGSPWVANPGWAYRPSYAVGLGGLLASLFTRPAYGSYYFGNYFGSPYRGLGYVPWTTYARRGYDPLLNYYSWTNRRTPNWSGGLTNLYAGRMNGSLPAPVTSLARPATSPSINPALVTRNTVNFSRNVSASPVSTLQPVQPLNRFDPSHVRLTNVTQADLVQRRPAVQTRQSFASPLSPRPNASVNSGVRSAPLQRGSSNRMNTITTNPVTPRSFPASPSVPRLVPAAARPPVTLTNPTPSLRQPVRPAVARPPVPQAAPRIQSPAPVVRSHPTQSFRPAPAVTPRVQTPVQAGPQIQSPAFRSAPAAPTFRSAPAAPAFHSAPATAPRFQPSAPAFRSAPTFRSAPASHSAPAFRSAPAHRGGPVNHGGGRGGRR